MVSASSTSWEWLKPKLKDLADRTNCYFDVKYETGRFDVAAWHEYEGEGTVDRRGFIITIPYNEPTTRTEDRLAELEGWLVTRLFEDGRVPLKKRQEIDQVA